jgi:hypothetical protein
LLGFAHMDTFREDFVPVGLAEILQNRNDA